MLPSPNPPKIAATISLSNTVWKIRAKGCCLLKRPSSRVFNDALQFEGRGRQAFVLTDFTKHSLRHHDVMSWSQKLTKSHIYIYIYLHLHVSISTSTCIYIYIYLYLHLHISISTSTYIYIYIYIYLYLHLHISISISTYIYIYIYIYLYLHISISTHIYIYIYILKQETGNQWPSRPLNSSLHDINLLPPEFNTKASNSWSLLR